MVWLLCSGTAPYLFVIQPSPDHKREHKAKKYCEYNHFIYAAFQCHFPHSNHKVVYLPLSLLPGQEPVQCSNNLLQRREVCLELLLDLGAVLAQLGVEVLPVRCGAHGGAEERLDDEGVVGLERAGVGLAERVGKLLGGVGEVVAEGLGGEVQAAVAGRVSDGLDGVWRKGERTG